MTPISTNLRRSLDTLEKKLRSLEEYEQHFDTESNSFVRWSVEFFSDADDWKENCHQDIDEARANIKRAYQSLTNGNLNDATVLAKMAGQYFLRADSYWRQYRQADIRGAETIIDGLRVVRNGAALFTGTALTLLTFGATAASAFGWVASATIHAGILLLLPTCLKSGGNVKKTNIENPSAPAPSSLPFPKERKKTEPNAPNLCLLEGKINGKPANVSQSSCPSPQLLLAAKKIFEAVGTPISVSLKPQDIPVIAAQAEQMAVGLAPIIPLPAYSKRTKEELIAQAKQALIDWKKNPRQKTDFAPFFIDIEFADDPNQDRYNKTRMEWDKHISKYKAALDSRGKTGAEALDLVMGSLFEDYLSNYTSRNALLTNFLEGEGGNCEAETKFALFAMIDAGIQLPDGQIFVVQHYNNHLVPAVYDKKTGEVLNLITGEKSATVLAPLYDPHLFLYAFLEKQKAQTPFPVDDLLVRGVPLPSLTKKRVPKDTTNSNLKFPHSPFTYPSENPPEKAIRPSPYNASMSNDISKIQAKSLTEIPPEYSESVQWEMEKDGLEIDFVKYEHYDEEENKSEESLVLRTEDQTKEYNAFETADQKRAYLLRLTHNTVNNAFKDPSLKLALALFSDPSKISRSSPEEIGRAIEALNNMEDKVRTAASAISDFLPPPRATEPNNAVQKIIYDQNPLLRLYIKKKWVLRKRILHNAIGFILFANTLSYENRGALFYFIDTIGTNSYGGYVFDDKPQKQFIRTIGNPQLLDLIEPEKPGVQHEYFEVEPLDDWRSPNDSPQLESPNIVPKTKSEEGKPGKADKPGRKGKKKKREREPYFTNNAPFRISMECMIDLLLKYHDHESVASRWSPRLSKKLLSLNRDGRYDSQFLSAYQSFAAKYPKADQNTPDPYNTEDCNYVFEEGSEEGREVCQKRFIPRDIEQVLTPIVERLSPVT